MASLTKTCLIYLTFSFIFYEHVLSSRLSKQVILRYYIKKSNQDNSTNISASVISDLYNAVGSTSFYNYNIKYTFKYIEPSTNNSFLNRVWVDIQLNQIDQSFLGKPFTDEMILDYLYDRFKTINESTESSIQVDNSLGMHIYFANSVDCFKEKDSIYGYSWPDLPAGERYIQTCHSMNNVGAFVSRHCGKLGWSDVENYRCNVTISKTPISTKLRLLERGIKYNEHISRKTILKESLNKLASLINQTEFVSVEEAQIGIAITNLIVKFDNHSNKKNIRIIQSIIMSIVRKTDLPEDGIDYQSTHIAVKIQKLSNLKGKSIVSFRVNQTTNETLLIRQHHKVDTKNANLIFMLKPLINGIALRNDSNSDRLAIVVIRNEQAFHALGDKLFSVLIPGLAGDIIFRNVILKRSELASANIHNQQCAYKNSQNWVWLEKSCNLDITNADVVCTCYRLPKMSAIINMYGPEILDNPEPGTQGLNLVPKIGSLISAALIGITVIRYIVLYKYTKPSEVPPGVVLVLLVCLLMSELLYFGNMMFVRYGTDVDWKTAGIVCRRAALFLLFFLLSSFTWIASYGYQMFVQLTNFRSEKVNMYMTCFGFGVPVFITFVATANQTGKHYSMVANEICWLNTNTSFILACALPAVAIAIVQCVVFYLSYQHIRGIPHDQVSFTIASIKWQLKVLLVLSVLFMVTWVFGIFTFKSDDRAFEYFFAISNSLLGIYVMLMYFALVIKPRTYNYHIAVDSKPVLFTDDNDMTLL